MQGGIEFVAVGVQDMVLLTFDTSERADCRYTHEELWHFPGALPRLFIPLRHDCTTV